MANVFELVADAVGHANTDVVDADIPLSNTTGSIPGPLNANAALRTAYPPPDASAVGAGGGPVLLAPLYHDEASEAPYEYVAVQPGWLSAPLADPGAGATAYVLPVLFVAAMGTAVVLARGGRAE
jgi:hypothetical protein